MRERIERFFFDTMDFTGRLFSLEGFMILLVVLAVLMIPLFIWASIADAISWNEFQVKHDCVKVAETRGEIFNTYGIDSKGGLTVGIGSTSSKTAYKCNDGVTYWR